MIMSPTAAAGSLFSLLLMPPTAMMYKFLAPTDKHKPVNITCTRRKRLSQSSPVLSAQLMTAPTGRPKEIRNFEPHAPPRPTSEKLDFAVKWDQPSEPLTSFRHWTARRKIKNKEKEQNVLKFSGNRFRIFEKWNCTCPFRIRWDWIGEALCKLQQSS